VDVISVIARCGHLPSSIFRAATPGPRQVLTSAPSSLGVCPLPTSSIAWLKPARPSGTSHVGCPEGYIAPRIPARGQGAPRELTGRSSTTAVDCRSGVTATRCVGSPGCGRSARHLAIAPRCNSRRGRRQVRCWRREAESLRAVTRINAANRRDKK
jgi:hypothetical protein